MKLKKLLIRHTKAQRIGGAVALALPTLASETEWLTFSDAEKVVYDKALFETQQDVSASRNKGSKVFSLNMQLSRTMQACAGVYDGWSTFDLSQPNKDGDEVVKRSTTRATGMEKLTYARGKETRKISKQDGQPLKKQHHRLTYNQIPFPTQAEITAARKSKTKLVALKRDLEKLIAEDRAMHAVVFTQHPAAHAAIVEMCEDIGAEIFSVSGKDKFEHRHQAIRDFQAGCDTVDGDNGGVGSSGGSTGAGGGDDVSETADEWVQCKECDARHTVPDGTSKGDTG